MGLSISHSIIEAHGGRMEALANSDRGLTFQFTLPIAAKGDARWTMSRRYLLLTTIQQRAAPSLPWSPLMA